MSKMSMKVFKQLSNDKVSITSLDSYRDYDDAVQFIIM